LHSTASDGTLPPAAVVEAAAAVALHAIALTDHDTLDGVDEARSAGERMGLRVLCGVELSALDGELEVHILGLHLQRTAELERHLAAFRATRRTRAEQIVERLNRLGVPVRLEAVLAIAGNGAIGRPHVARAIIEGGWARDTRDAFDRLLGNGGPAYVPKQRLSLSDAVQLVRRAGGLSIWAHPGQQGRLARVQQLVAAGIDGIEIRHPSHSTDDIARLHALADHLKLLPSGGSDWHGARDGPRTIGSMRVPSDWLDQQETRLRERCAQELVA
jgi:predicted metal-dependent phosphoesterase TrpH